MPIGRKLLRGSDARLTRLHDEQGNRVSLSRLARNGPRALATGVGRVLFGRRGGRPWISYDAQAAIAAHLTPAARVLEFGSGTSTLWYAQRAGEVVSIEDDPAWYDRVAAILRTQGIGNVRLRLATSVDEYVQATAAERGDGFDLVMVDGSARDRCLAASVGLLRPGGILYLDNADMGGSDPVGSVPTARARALALAAETGATVRWFTDFAPTQMFVQQGLMVTLPTLTA